MTTRGTIVLAAERREVVEEARERGHALGHFRYEQGADGRFRGVATCGRCGRAAHVGVPWDERGAARTADCDRAPTEAWLRTAIATADGARSPVALSPTATKTLLWALTLAADTIRQNAFYSLGYEPTRGQGDKALAEIRRARIELLEGQA